MKKQNDVIDNLIQTLKDGREGFKQAAESVSNPNLKSLFRDYSQQRSRFANALQSEARRQRETDPETSSSDRRVASRLDQLEIGDHRRR